MGPEIVGKFRAKQIRIGIEYEIRLMIMLDRDASGLEDVVEIELKLPGGSKLQRTEILENQPGEIWTEICIGKFMMKEPQQISEELEFSLRQQASMSFWNVDRKLSIKGVRIVVV